MVKSSAQPHATTHAFHHHICDGFLSKIHRSTARGVAIPIHPSEGYAGVPLAGRGYLAGGGSHGDAKSETAICPAHTDGGSVGENPAQEIVAFGRASSHLDRKRRDESRRGRHECLRNIEPRHLSPNWFLSRNTWPASGAGENVSGFKPSSKSSAGLLLRERSSSEVR